MFDDANFSYASEEKHEPFIMATLELRRGHVH